MIAGLVNLVLVLLGGAGILLLMVMPFFGFYAIAWVADTSVVAVRLIASPPRLHKLNVGEK